MPADVSAVYDISPRNQPRGGNQPIAKRLVYTVRSMIESDVFVGLLFLSVCVAVFGTVVQVLPGTDTVSLENRYLLINQRKFVITFKKRCPNCGEHLTGNFCSNCGQSKQETSELTFWGVIMKMVPDVLNIDFKFFRTLRTLFLRPGFLTNEYLRIHHASYAVPFQLYVAIAAVFFFASTNIDFNVDTVAPYVQGFTQRIEAKAKATNTSTDLVKEKLSEDVENYIPIYTFIMVILFAACLKVFYPYWHYVEHFIFSLHFITAFLLIWMFFIVVGLKVPFVKGAFEPYFILVPSLIYLVIALREVHPSRPLWLMAPIILCFLAIFIAYTAVSLTIGLLLL